MALVQVAIYDALVAGEDARRGNLPEEAVAAGAASKVLLYLFPADELRIQDATTSQFGTHHLKGNFARAWFLGQRVGELVVLHGQSDGSDAVFTGTPPAGDCIWTGANPVLPMCGTWKTWITTSGDEFQPEPPYACGSADDLREVEEVYQASLVRTPEQIAIVHKWADLPPPTVWNGYLNARLLRERWAALASARAHAFLNIAMYDAFVCCWNTKYAYWTARPFMRLTGRSPAFTTVITTPNFPSYTSGHSTISGAAGEVMGELFPEEAAFFQAEAEEAALSRFWGGIHFHKDDNEGLVVGKKIGEKVVARMRSDGALPPLADK
ncbi:MAG: vanadium-dependent haloperoxidase [candidate division Zixibacteria bacterium]|nr:vanadium-dependent haloperoxidase [candidate division Zixibacteria bacterium]